MKAIQDIATGLAIGTAILCTLAMPACGTAVTPQLVLCQAAASRVLPEDPKMVTPYDLEDLIARLNQCRAQAGAADGGSP